MSKFDRIRLWATPVLLVLFVLLVLVYLVTRGIINPSRLGASKDTLAAVGSICTTVTVLTTGVLAYYRFFRGRMFTLRLELNSEVTMVDGPHTASLGLLTVSVKNIGNITAWDPLVTAKIKYRYVDGRVVENELAHWDDDIVRTSRRNVKAIDPGECSTFSREIFIDHDVWAVTHQVGVTSAGHQWSIVRVQEGPAVHRRGGK
ncbi:hypothetical protein [Amycolatopsis sp. DG1A-15b]|uniref:hypothetical protein n=1 Tax=Amycolatopsis sp. DG1A-15b TaxID=3052846 RepID=UPI00255BB645|nr:hypothetical protein [Amycolatopsis sp. DG1A-15b]WIX85727.1 hypothetical protein QRY02_31550 [Amycolatopsis sp. DG1A-15b]